MFLGAVLGQHIARSTVRPDGTVVQKRAWTLVHTSINSRHDLIRPDLVCATPRNAVKRDGEAGQKVSQEHKEGRSQSQDKTKRLGISLDWKETLREDGPRVEVISKR